MLKSPYFYIYVKICLSSCSGVSVLCAFLVAVNAYGPSPPILSGVSRITHSSPDLMNQEKFSRFFNILKYFFYLLRTRACLIRFMYPALTFWFLSLCLLSIRITTILSSLVSITSTATLSNKFDLVEYSLCIFYVCTLLLLFPKFIVK